MIEKEYTCIDCIYFQRDCCIFTPQACRELKLSNYKFELQDRVRVRNTTLEGVVLHRHTNIGSKTRRVSMETTIYTYTIVLDTIKDLYFWYKEDQLVLASKLKTNKIRKLIVP